MKYFIYKSSTIPSKVQKKGEKRRNLVGNERKRVITKVFNRKVNKTSFIQGLKKKIIMLETIKRCYKKMTIKRCPRGTNEQETNYSNC